MKISLNELRLKITDLEKDYNNKLKKLTTNALVVQIKELNGHIELMSTPFKFNDELYETQNILKQLTYCKGILMKANNSTNIDEIDTIQSAIIKLQEKRKLLNEIDFILTNSKAKKIRKVDGNFGNNSAYYENISLNFNESELKTFKKNLKEEINNLDLKIQNTNNTKVEIKEEV